MWWESGTDNKESKAEGSNDNIPITPLLLPSQSTPTIQRASPLPIVVPDVQDLKEQFQQQQSIITQIKETLKQNESQLSSKEKQVEAYANRLSQIKARSKTKSTEAASTPSPVRKRSTENLESSGGKVKLSTKGKVNELKKRLEENKLKFEERTGKELSDTKKIESLVEHLQKQLEERDVTIQDLRKTIELPAKKADTLPRRKNKENCASKSTQTSQGPTNETLDLQSKIYELETSVMDLNESLKEKESVIEARTQAVTLLTQDLSMKGKNTLDNLEETRQEMRTMQSNFVVIQDQLQKELIEKEEKLTQYEEKNKRLESINFDLSVKNAELQEKLVNLQSRNVGLESEIKSIKESVNADDRLEVLTKKTEFLTKELDDSNKSMIKMKLEHKNKIKALNKTLEKVSNTSDEKAEMIRLEKKVEELESIKEKLENKLIELEEEKGNLLLSVLDVDDFKASESRLNNQILELQSRIQQQNDDLDSHLKVISNLESEKIDLMQANQDQNILIENLYAKIQKIEAENRNLIEFDSAAKAEISDLNSKIEALESQYNSKIEELKAEHCKEIELVETFYNAKGEGVNKKELEEFRISNELNNIHVEEQIELLVREKQQLLEKLKNLSGVSSTDSLTFEKMEHSDLKDDKEITPTPDDLLSFDPNKSTDEDPSDNRLLHLQRLNSEQQIMITDFETTLAEERRKISSYQTKIKELEETIHNLEESNNQYKAQFQTLERPPEPSSGGLKLNANTKNKIKKMQIELAENRRIVKEQTERVKELNSKLEEKEELIKNYIEKLENFEKDDWGRENDWKTNKEDFDNIQELQKKCLSLENNLIELNEDCERLRKENIEIVHLLSEEKVQRKKLQEELDARPESQVVMEEKYSESMEESVEVLAKSVAAMDESVRFENLEERVENLNRINAELEEKVKQLEINQENNTELQEKLEWSNVVLTSKDTEIFRLQNLLEDQGKIIENLERDLREGNEKLGEILEELSGKELHLMEMSTNFDRLKESVDVANQTIMTNEGQLKELLETVGRMEEDVSKKENELKEIKGILAEKNLDMTNLRERLEEVNSDLTVSYQEHLENMRKCLRDKESDYEELLAEKSHLEELIKNLVSDKEEIYNQKMEFQRTNEELERIIHEKEKIISELGSKEKSNDVEDLKVKMKKLAANLKKKAQNEKDLLQQVKEFEEFIVEKDKNIAKIREELVTVSEKWESEKSEKEQYKKEFEFVISERDSLIIERDSLVSEMNSLVSQRDSLISANADLSERIATVETEYKNSEEKNEYKFQQMETQLQKMYENSERWRIVQQQDKRMIEDFERRVAELSKSCEEKTFEVEGERRKMEEAGRELLDVKMMAEEERRKKEEIELKLGEREEFVEDVRRENEERGRRLMELDGVVEEERRRSEHFGRSLTERDEMIRNLRNTLEEFQQKCNIWQEEKNDLDSQIAKHEDYVAELRNKVALLEESNLNLSNELMATLSERDEIQQTVTQLTEEKNRLEEKLKDKPVKRKSVTFRTDEVEYIKELKSQIHNYNDELKQAKLEIKNLKKALLQENVKNAVTEVILEAREKVETLKEEKEPEIIEDIVVENKAEVEIRAGAETTEPSSIISFEITETLEPQQAKTVESTPPFAEPETKFNAAAFFGTGAPTDFFDFAQKPETVDPFNENLDSLAWDDDWGTDGHLEEQFLSTKQEPKQEEELKRLQAELKGLQLEKQDLLELVKKNQNEYSKKLKEQKSLIDALQSELNKLKNNAGFSDLDDAIIDELKSQITKLENKGAELTKELLNSKSEKENLLKRIEVLNDGNERFLEMKERQDNEAQIWKLKNQELLKEINELRNQVDNPVVADDSVLSAENKGLKNQVEGLEWEICELKESLEEKQEKLDELMNLENKSSDDQSLIQELQGQVSALAAENESLQEILNNMKSTKKETEGSKIFDYFQSAPADDFFAQPNELEILKKEKQSWSDRETELVKNYESLNMEFELLKRQLQDSNNYLTERHETCEKLQFRLNELELLMQGKERFISELQAKLSEKMNLEEIVLIFKNEIEDLSRALAEERTKSAQFQQEKDQLLSEFRNEEKSNLEENVLIFKMEIENLNRALAEERMKSAQIQQEKDQLLSEIRNEEKANLEESALIFRSEIDRLNGVLTEERSRTAEILYERDRLLEEIRSLNNRIHDTENKFKELTAEENKQRLLTNEYSEFREELEKTARNLQIELERTKFELSTTKRELEEIQNTKDDAISKLKSQLTELESELTEISEKKEFELDQLKCEIRERINYYENLMENKTKDKDEQNVLRGHLYDLEKQLETLKTELQVKDNDIFEISQMSEEEQKQISNLKDLLVAKDDEIKDLKDTLRELQNEISHFRNFEKQVKELRQAQIRSLDSNAPVTNEGDPDLTDWSEHELAELNSRLQSDLDTALYMLHQRDVRCDELTFELMQLLEERDTLQLRLSTAIRINEERRSRHTDGNISPVHDLQDNRHLADQSSDTMPQNLDVPGEDFNQLQKKISELHSVGYIRDKTLRDESVQRHRDQMSLLGRVSDSDISLSRDVQSPPTVLLNWIKGKTTPKVMHI